MGEITLKVEEDMLDKLRAQAVSRGRTPEEEAQRILDAGIGAESAEERDRRILREKVLAALAGEVKRPKLSPEEAVRRAREIASMSPPIRGIDLTQLIREDRDR